MPNNQRRFGRQGPGRPMKRRNIRGPSMIGAYIPRDAPDGEPIIIGIDEVEALRLVDHLGQSQEEAAVSMGVSRGTIWRCVDSGRRKMISMIVEGRPLIVSDTGASISDEDGTIN